MGKEETSECVTSAGLCSSRRGHLKHQHSMCTCCFRRSDLITSALHSFIAPPPPFFFTFPPKVTDWAAQTGSHRGNGQHLLLFEIKSPPTPFTPVLLPKFSPHTYLPVPSPQALLPQSNHFETRSLQHWHPWTLWDLRFPFPGLRKLEATMSMCFWVCLHVCANKK